MPICNNLDHMNRKITSPNWQLGGLRAEQPLNNLSLQLYEEGDRERALIADLKFSTWVGEREVSCKCALK